MGAGLGVWCSVFVSRRLRTDAEASSDGTFHAYLCERVFDHASEARCFREAFDAICHNPSSGMRKVERAPERLAFLFFSEVISRSRCLESCTVQPVGYRGRLLWIWP